MVSLSVCIPQQTYVHLPAPYRVSQPKTVDTMCYGEQTSSRHVMEIMRHLYRIVLLKAKEQSEVQTVIGSSWITKMTNAATSSVLAQQKQSWPAQLRACVCQTRDWRVSAFTHLCVCDCHIHLAYMPVHVR